VIFCAICDRVFGGEPECWYSACPHPEHAAPVHHSCLTLVLALNAWRKRCGTMHECVPAAAARNALWN
jgi:hypothetical protein